MRINYVTRLLVVLSLCVSLFQISTPASAAGLEIGGTTSGSTPFISYVSVTGLAPSAFISASFTVLTKSGGSASPISATYTKQSLINRNYYTAGATSVVVPVFGLYQNRANSVQIKINQSRRITTLTTTILTSAWEDSRYLSPTKLQARDTSVALNYSYFMLKNWDTPYSPTIMDVDGELRWVGDTPGYYPSQASTMIDGSIFYGSGTTLLRLELDGTYSVLNDYAASHNVTYVGHHNYDLGKNGILLEVDRTTDIESTILEVDKSGNVLKTFDFNQIIEDAMISGGDNPADFVVRWNDWFHMNAATYWKSQNTLVASSRENFVIAIDYDTKKIKWILGDTSKYWHTFPSLRKFALKLSPGSLPPIGQHAVSISTGDELLLFDNGLQSFNQPALPGYSRSYAAPRRYKINVSKKTATMTWSFEHNQNIYSPICSSIYEVKGTYIINYASVDWGASIRLIGLGAKDKVAFDYLLPGGWGNGWNAQPISLEKLSFTR